MEYSRQWTFERKKLLLDCRLKNENEFNSKRKKKSVLGQQVLNNIKQIESEFPFNKDEIYRKFLNLMVTYKRIKKRNSSSGQAATSWEFFDIMDEVYGTKTFIVTPKENVESSLVEIDIFDDSFGLQPEPQPTPIKEPSKKCPKVNEVLEFLKAESEEDKKIMKELIDLEKEKLRAEKERIEEIKELKDLLKSLIN